MARRQTVARRYAEAAFEISREAGKLDVWERDLRALRDAITDPRLAEVVEHPAVPFAEKERAVRAIVGEAVAREPMSLVLLMIRRGHPGQIGRTVERFEELVRRERGIARAEVRTALALDAEQRRAVMDRLAELTGEQIEIDEAVDESLIGGISVRIGDRLYDASVRSRLERLRARVAAA